MRNKTYVIKYHSLYVKVIRLQKYKFEQRNFYMTSIHVLEFSIVILTLINQIE